MRQFLNLSIALCMLPIAADAADPQPTPPPATVNQGCLHRSLQDCLAWVRQTFMIAGKDDFDAQIAIFDKTDINGKPLYKTGLVSGPVVMRAGQGIIGLGISVDDHRTVTKMAVVLNSDPSEARTEDEYQATGLYDAVVAAVGADCPEAANRIAMYRYFENSIKPKISLISSGIDGGYGYSSDESLIRSMPIRFCGHGLMFEKLSGRSTDQISLENTSGYFSRPTITFRD